MLVNLKHGEVLDVNAVLGSKPKDINVIGLVKNGTTYNFVEPAVITKINSKSKLPAKDSYISNSIKKTINSFDSNSLAIIGEIKRPTFFVVGLDKQYAKLEYLEGNFDAVVLNLIGGEQ